jgi:hypothetical protein
MRRRIDITPGQRFARLVALERYEGNFWLCHCDCGTNTIVRANRLDRGWTQSCGCLWREKCRPHRSRRVGDLSTKKEHRKEWISYRGMVERCTNKNASSYKNYGGRGISVCPRWYYSFRCFLKDMGPRPSRHHTLDRIDNNGPYSPENCCWKTHKEQRRNTRANRNITWQGQTRCITDWAKHLGISRGTLNNRLNRSWDLEDVFNKPVGHGIRRTLYRQKAS